MYKSIGAIIDLNNRPELFEYAAAWFHEKWNVPKQAYLNSMTSAVTSTNAVPRWYIVVDNDQKIIAGIGVIENDFHKRIDLTPNLCALYVEEEYRNHGIAKALLDNACEKLLRAGINTTYLITSHSNFYERCGWTFFDMIEEDDGNMIRMYQHTK